MEPRSLLIVDDDPAFCGRAGELLTAGGHRVVIETVARRVLSLLDRQTFDAVLLDLLTPALDGLELLQRMRKKFSALPILVVSARGRSRATAAGIRGGATDFLVKPIDAHLELRIDRACELERIRRRAVTDGLTGLYDHRYLHERLQQELERAERYGRRLSVVMADLDHFKTYNDAFGHPSGNDLLVAVAGTLRRVCRACDVVGRYGGDEFTILLPETPPQETGLEDAWRTAERARLGIRSLRLEGGARPPAPVTLSLGVASLSAACRRPRDLFAAADRALYRAKRQGRDRVCVSAPPAGDDAARRSPLAA